MSRQHPAWSPFAPGVNWAPKNLVWLLNANFMVGSTLFGIATCPGLVEHLETSTSNLLCFIGAFFFTAAGFMQLVDSMGDTARASSAFSSMFRITSVAWWVAIIQFSGTIAFNFTTGAALHDSLNNALSTEQADARIWGPDYVGSILFLLSAVIAVTAAWYGLVRPLRRSVPWFSTVIGFLGCVFFMASAIGAFAPPDTGELINPTIANLGTFLGVVCFFWASRLGQIDLRAAPGLIEKSLPSPA